MSECIVTDIKKCKGFLKTGQFIILGDEMAWLLPQFGVQAAELHHHSYEKFPEMGQIY